MHLQFLARTVAAVITAMIAAVASAGEIASIDQAALLKRIDEKDASLIILDVRTPEEFSAGHVPGAINIPYTHLPARIAELPSVAEKDIVVYCAVGVRAAKAVSIFKENGFTRLLRIDGDMEQWQKNHRPVER